MEPCLYDNKICSNKQLKCKECTLNFCKEAILMYESFEEKLKKNKIKEIKGALPIECRECSFLSILSIEKKRVYCPYRINKCILL